MIEKIDISDASIAEEIRKKMEEVTTSFKGLMGTSLFDLAFKNATLPSAGSNITGNHDGRDSGYGWYNNTNTPSNNYAPGYSAGLFMRLKSGHISICFFLPTMASKVGELWWRKDGAESCSKVS